MTLEMFSVPIHQVGLARSILSHRKFRINVPVNLPSFLLPHIPPDSKPTQSLPQDQNELISLVVKQGANEISVVPDFKMVREQRWEDIRQSFLSVINLIRPVAEVNLLLLTHPEQLNKEKQLPVPSSTPSNLNTEQALQMYSLSKKEIEQLIQVIYPLGIDAISIRDVQCLQTNLKLKMLATDQEEREKKFIVDETGTKKEIKVRQEIKDPELTIPSSSLPLLANVVNEQIKKLSQRHSLLRPLDIHVFGTGLDQSLVTELGKLNTIRVGSPYARVYLEKWIKYC